MIVCIFLFVFEFCVILLLMEVIGFFYNVLENVCGMSVYVFYWMLFFCMW